jgi:hypothetical protein
MTVAIKTYAETGCPYGDRLRLALSMMDLKFENVSNEILSGTVNFDGSQISGIINIGLTLEANGVTGFFPTNENKRERQIKLAKLFEIKLTRLFNDAFDSSIYRGQGYYMFMESLSVFENELIRCGKYFGGSEVGFLDIVLYPWIARIGIWTPEFLKGELVRLQAWRRRMKDHQLVTSDPMKATRSQLLKYVKKLRGDDDTKYKLQRLNSCGD